MEQQARCKKCGRVLKSPQSIAMGMGSTCAGVNFSYGNTFHAQIKRSSRKAYRSRNTHIEVTGMQGDLSFKPLSKKEATHKAREERRRLFEERQPFQCGVLSHARTPIIYMPAGGADWKESCSGRVISHERLQQYLTRYKLI